MMVLENLEIHKFPPGKSGNPNGRPKGKKNVSTVLKEHLSRIAPDSVVDEIFIREFCRGKKRITQAEAIVARLLHEAIFKGEAWAVREILDRTEGKAVQGLELSGKDGGPIEITSAIDLSKLTDEELQQYEVLLSKAHFGSNI